MDGKCLDENNQTMVEAMRQYKDGQYVGAYETARNLIETSIQISRGAQITSDAVLLAVENEIEVLFNNRTGKPMACIWSPKYRPVATIRKGRKRVRDAAFFFIIMLVTFAATLLKPQKYVSSRTIQKCVEHVSTST